MAKGSSDNTKKPDFHIRNSNLDLKKEIINIAKHKGISYSAFLRSRIIEIRDSFPAHMRQPLPKD